MPWDDLPDDVPRGRATPKEVWHELVQHDRDTAIQHDYVVEEMPVGQIASKYSLSRQRITDIVSGRKRDAMGRPLGYTSARAIIASRGPQKKWWPGPVIDRDALICVQQMRLRDKSAVARQFGLSRRQVRRVRQNPRAQQAAITLLKSEGFLRF